MNRSVLVPRAVQCAVPRGGFSGLSVRVGHCVLSLGGSCLRRFDCVLELSPAVLDKIALWPGRWLPSGASFLSDVRQVRGAEVADLIAEVDAGGHGATQALRELRAGAWIAAETWRREGG